MRDSDTSSNRALRLEPQEPNVLVHTSAERRLAAEHWLLSTLDEPRRDGARMDWQQQGMALLPLGTLFSAVRFPGRLVTAAAGRLPQQELDAVLDEVLDGGPVICDPHGERYYALVPASMPDRWQQAADDWRAVGVECLGRGTYLGVPKIDAVELNPRAWGAYWSVPMSSAATLCAPLAVARLIAAGSLRMSENEAGR